MVVKSDEFSLNQIKFYETVLNARHIDEKMGRTFAELFDENELNRSLLRYIDVLSFKINFFAVIGSSSMSDFDEMTSTCSSNSNSTCSEFNT